MQGDLEGAIDGYERNLDEHGDPEELRTGLPDEAMHGSFSWSPDGHRIAFIAMMGGDAEFWLISDFLP